MTVFIEVSKGKNGVARCAAAHATERLVYATRLLRLLDSADKLESQAARKSTRNVRRKFAARAMREAIDMLEIAAIIVEADITH